jgi:hypothetical protein
MTGRALLLLLAALAAPAHLAAQRPVLVGDDGSRAARIAREVLDRGQYTWIDRDTILGPDFTARDLVVHDAEVRLEGSVTGSALVLGGDLWIRPGGRVGGSVAVLGGGVYPAGLAVLDRDSVFHTDPRGRVTIGTRPGEDGEATVYVATVELAPPPRPAAVSPVLTALPTYDRVSGVTLRAEALVRPTRDADGPAVNLWATFRMLQDDRLGGGAAWRVPLGVQGLHLTGEASRATRTNDGWIFGAIANSTRAATLGTDHRDYWDADLLRMGVERRVDRPLIAGESWLGPRAAVQLSRDRSLPTRSPWSLFGREGLERENPPVLEGTIVSLLAGTAYQWRAPTSRLDGSLDVEHGLAGAGDAGFTQALVVGSYQALALRTHQLRVYFRGMAPLFGSAPPPQRYGILGGSGTLPSEPIARFRGDHLAYVESSYLVPIPWVVLPVVGSPGVEAVHKVGAAWVGGAEPEWVQNAGVGVVFSFVSARALFNPAERPVRPHFAFGLSIPQR